MDNFLPLKYQIESPLINESVNNSVRVKGWVLSPGGIKRASLFYDDEIIPIRIRIDRPDIFKQYPDYKLLNCGFDFTLDAVSFTGYKTLKFTFIDDRDNVVEKEVFIQRSEKETIIKLDNLSNGQILNRGDNLFGHVLPKDLTNSKITTHYVKLSDMSRTTIPNTYGLANDDVYNEYPEYNNPNSGFSILYKDLPHLEGNYRLETVITNSKTSEKTVSTKEFTYHYCPNKFEVESPTINQMIKGELVFNGYFIGDELTSITININDTITKNAEMNIYREDIYSEYRRYSQPNSGWEAILYTDELPQGNHKATISFNRKNDTPITTSINFIKSEEKWFDSYNDGDVPSKNILLQEIKQNLINVIEDYKGLGIENEVGLQNDVKSLFTGEIIPSNKDWTIITSVLSELAEKKERGQAYRKFISDLDNGLGVSDLYKIKEFINYIQKLGPINASVTSVIDKPNTYQLLNIQTKTEGKFTKTIELSWEKEGFKYGNGLITYPRNVVEDVLRYETYVTAGNYSKATIHNGTDPKDIKYPLEWDKWFDAGHKNPVLEVNHTVIDKRGNTNKAQPVFSKLDGTVVLGPDYYEIETSMDNGAWIPLVYTSNMNYTHILPEVIGNRRYRVRGIDKNKIYITNWLISRPVALDFLPPTPGTPNPKASPDYTWADITWNKCEFAESYDVYIGTNKGNAQKNKGWFYNTKNTKQRLSGLKENTNYVATVVAINRKDSRSKSVNFKTKQKTPKVVTFNSTGVKVFRESFQRRVPGGYEPWQGPNWRHETRDVMQAEWVETWPDGWQPRGGGAYWAYKGQNWGNNRTCIIYNTGDIQSKLKNKKITKVEFSLSRHNTIHGWQTATPLHPCNHNETNANLSGGRPNMYNLKTCSGSVSRGNSIVWSDNNTKFLLEQIVNGKNKGIGFHKAYGGPYAVGPQGDKAYARFVGKLQIKVTYFD